MTKTTLVLVIRRTKIIFFVPNNDHVICACSNVNSTIFSVLGAAHSFLIDTGASLSVVRYEDIIRWNIPYHIERVRINGIGGDIFSEGYTYLDLQYNDQYFRHKFYIIKNLPCRTDGIIGQDFLSKFKCILNFELNTMTLINHDKAVTLLLQMGRLGFNNFITLPPRCESLHYIDTSYLHDCVVSSKTLCEGVYIASLIVTPRKGRIPIKILNTRDVEVKLSYFMPSVSPLDSFDICSFGNTLINADRVKKMFSLLDLKHLNTEEQISIENICAKYSDIFYIDGDKLGVTNVYNQSIQLKENVTPVYVKPYRLPKSQKFEINRQVEKMLEDDIIEETQSEWSSPLLIVPKKTDTTGEKKWRVVVDYRKLNERIKDDKFPLPNISDILDSLSGAVYFTHLDLNQSYYQVNLNPESRKYTAFTTNKQYQMKRLPMGLKISPSAFSRVMTVAMSGLNYEKCLIYLDDLICFGRNLDQHNKNLIDIFERIRKVNLKLNPVKCQFLKKQILYLGHVVSSEGIRPDPEKTKTIENYPRPSSSDEVRRFVAFANYYRKFIPNFAEITIPLNKLCRKGTLFEWTNKCEKSYLCLKNSLATPPILQYPDFSEENEFILHTDASGIAIGSMLCNKDNLPIAYASRALNKAELNYPTIEKELLAIVWSVRYFRPYLFGKKFVIRSDHKPLVYLFNINSPSSRLLKFRLSLEEYDYRIEYVKGANNVAADALSRIIVTSEELKEMNKHVMGVMTRSMKKRMDQIQNDENVSVDKCTTNSWTDHPKVVEMLKKPKHCVELVTLDSPNSTYFSERQEGFSYSPVDAKIYVNLQSRSCSARAAFVRDFGLYCQKIKCDEIYIIKTKKSCKIIKWLTNEIKNNSKWSGPRLCVINDVIPVGKNDDKKVILNDFHLLPTSGHAGVRRMMNNIKRRYFWPNMERDVKDFVRKCDKCQRQKHSLPTKQPMQVTTTSNSAFDKLYLDIVGPLDKDYNNYSYILTLQCELTKYVEAYPLESKDSISVARAFVQNFILRYGIPREIATDRGTEFISSTMSEVSKLLHINQISSTAYHHQSIGSLENSHKSLNSFLRIQTDNNSRSWSTWLPYWCFSYNTTVHTETKYTPYELVFGKQCCIPSNLNNSHVEPLYNSENYALELKFRLQKSQQDARNNLIVSKNVRKNVYDSYTNPVMYEKGDLLLVKNEVGNKFKSLYSGPYEVIKDVSPNVEILKQGKIEVIHKNRTKFYHS